MDEEGFGLEERVGGVEPPKNNEDEVGEERLAPGL